MVLVERRIGLLFAFFLCLILLAGLRSLQLGTLKGDMLAKAAASQQTADTVVPAHRGTIVDRKGVELAVSEAADDVSATPYLVPNKGKAAKQLAPLLGVRRGHGPQEAQQRDSGFVYLGRHVPGDQADKIRKLDIPGIDLAPGQRRTYPRDYLASQVLGTVNMAGKGASGLEYSLDDAAARHRRRAPRRARRRRRGRQGRRPSRRAKPGAEVELALDANDPGQGRERAQGRRRDLPPQGRDRDRHRPADRRDPRAGQLAAGQRQRPVRRAGLRQPEPRGRHHL